MKIYYMHTLNGRPAYFDGRTLWFWDNMRQITPRLAESLKQIRKEQEKAKFWWREQGRGDEADRACDYIRIAIASPTNHGAGGEGG